MLFWFLFYLLRKLGMYCTNLSGGIEGCSFGVLDEAFLFFSFFSVALEEGEGRSRRSRFRKWVVCLMKMN